MHPAERMTNFDRQPGSIDDPDAPGGQDVSVDRLPPGDTADDIGAGGQPEVAELDLPGPNDPVAWNYVESGTDVVGPDGTRVGRVKQMVGTEEGIFHGIAVDPDGSGRPRLVSAGEVTALTPAKVTIALDAEGLSALEEYQPPG